MIEKLFGEYYKEVYAVIDFIIGRPNRAMYFAFLLLFLNTAAVAFKQRSLDTIAFLEKTFAYLAAMMLGNIVDSLAVDAMFEWEGSTQFLICLYLVSREASIIKNYLSDRYGLEIPVLNERLNQMEQQTQYVPGAQESEVMRARIESLNRELEELRQGQQQLPPGTEPTLGDMEPVVVPEMGPETEV